MTSPTIVPRFRALLLVSLLLVAGCSKQTSPTGPSIVVDTVVRERLRGSVTHEVEILGDSRVAITLTVERDGRRSVHHIPWVYPIVIKDIEVMCSGELRDDKPRACDGDPFPKGKIVRMTVRSTTNAEPFHVRTNYLKVNGIDQQDGMTFSVANVLPRDIAPNSALAAGDYRVLIEVNPPPHTIRKELTLRVR